LWNCEEAIEITIAIFGCKEVCNVPWVIKSRRMRWAGHVARMGGGESRVQGFGGVKSRRIRWAGHVAQMGEGRGVYRVLVG
jgi:hypothetical protein